MSCGNCGSESGDVSYSDGGNTWFFCYGCGAWTKKENPLLRRLERDVGVRA
jgi:hypothetical protein